MSHSRISNRRLTDAGDVAHIEAAHVVEVRTVCRIPVANVVPSPWQPRVCFEPDDASTALAESIRLNGVIQPIAVRVLLGDRYELVAGERRLRACKALGETFIPAYIHLSLSDAGACAMTAAENFARQDLTSLEEARAVAQLQCVRRAEGLPDDVRAVGDAVGRSKSLVAELVKINAKISTVVIALVRDTFGPAAEQSAVRATKERLLRAANQATPELAANVLAGSHRKLRASAIAGEGADDTYVHDVDSIAEDGLVHVVDNGTDQPDDCAFKVVWGGSKRLRISTAGPVVALSPHDAAQMLVALEPVLTAIRLRAALAA